MQLAVGVDRLVFLPDCDDSLDPVLPSCNHGGDSTALCAQAPAGSIDADPDVDVPFFANECRTDVTVESTINSFRLRTD